MRLRGFIVVLVIAAALLSVASLAWACTIVSGQTRINGATSASVARSGTISNITGDGIQAAPPNDGTSWSIVAGTQQNYCMTYVHTIATGVILNHAATPDLPSTNGTAPSTQGTYYVCHIYSSYSTNWAVLTVT